MNIHPARCLLQVGGFLQRIDYVRKHAFAVMSILKNPEGQFPIRYVGQAASSPSCTRSINLQTATCLAFIPFQERRLSAISGQQQLFYHVQQGLASLKYGCNSQRFCAGGSGSSGGRTFPLS